MDKEGVLMEKNEKILLMKLTSQDHINGQTLASYIGMSSRSVRTLIKRINQTIQGAVIESGSFGYRLVIHDSDAFLKYMQNDTYEVVDRFSQLFYLFIENDEYLKIDDLCEKIYLSRAQLKLELKKIRAYFSEYGVMISTKAHYGMYLQGNEFNIRKAIFSYKDLHIEQDNYNKVKQILISAISNYDLIVDDEILQNLTRYVYISCQRIIENKYIDLSNDWLEDLKEEKEWNYACGIMMILKNMLHIEYNENEIGYLTIHLCGINHNFDTVHIDQEIYQIIHMMLSVVDESSGLQLSKDFNLQLSLSFHLFPLIKRIKYKTYMFNPLTKEIKQKFIIAYELALKGCKVINECFNCQLPEDEIAYFALHINLSLEQNFVHIQKKNIMVVCSSGLASAKLLEYFFKKNFNKYIQHLEVSSVYELDFKDLSTYDVIFTTVPLNIQTTIPIITISHLMDYQDKDKIAQSFRNMNYDVMHYFPKDLFFVCDSFETKEEAIHKIVNECKKNYELPNEFEQFILEREKMASTEFNKWIAFPHCNKPITDQTFVSVTVLKKPLLWNKEKIRIILLSSVEKTSIKDLDDFYQLISTFLMDETLQWRLIQNPKYEILKQIIQEINK